MVDEPSLVAFKSCIDDVGVYSEEVGAAVVSGQVGVDNLLPMICKRRPYLFSYIFDYSIAISDFFTCKQSPVMNPTP
mgnify:CR=1 FL=1